MAGAKYRDIVEAVGKELRKRPPGVGKIRRAKGPVKLGAKVGAKK